MSLVCLIPARGGSKEIPNKNKKLFCGKPLIQWTIECALSSKKIDRTIVSTDDPEIAEISKQNGAEVPFLRPPKLALDNSPTVETVIHCLENISNVNSLLLLQATSPLRTEEDIEGILAMQRKHSAESIVSINKVSEHPSYMFNLNLGNKLSPFIEEDLPYRRQDLEEIYILNGAMYFINVDLLIKEKKLINSSSLGYIMPLERSIDIDTQDDWNLAEYIMNKKLNPPIF